MGGEGLCSGFGVAREAQSRDEIEPNGEEEEGRSARTKQGMQEELENIQNDEMLEQAKGFVVLGEIRLVGLPIGVTG